MKIGKQMVRHLDHEIGLRAVHLLAGGCGAVCAVRKLRKKTGRRLHGVGEMARYLQNRRRQIKSGLRLYDAGARVTAAVARELARKGTR